jgi:hypothetical protein
MKNLMFLMSLCLLIAIGCSKDVEVLPGLDKGLSTTMKEDIALDTRHHPQKPPKMVPLKGEVIEVGIGEPLVCFGIPYFGQFLDIKGHLTHLGNTEGGFVNLTNCRMEVREGIQTIVVDSDGQFQAANGDLLFYTGEVTVVIGETGPVIFNRNEFDGGTGRWEEAQGYFIADSEHLEDGSLLLEISGWITPPGR